MGIKDTLKNFIGVPDEEEYDDYDYDMEVPPSLRERERESREREREYHQQEPSSPYINEVEEHRSNRVVNIHATTQLQVVLIKPERYEDGCSIADHLKEKRTVVLNLENTNKEIARRLLDFLCGAAYANNGQVKKVASNTFLVTPYNVDLMGDLMDELENSGVIF